MRAPRSLVASDPRRFGRALAVPRDNQRSLSDDAQLFAATFAGGFIFVSIFLA